MRALTQLVCHQPSLSGSARGTLCADEGGLQEYEECVNGREGRRWTRKDFVAAVVAVVAVVAEGWSMTHLLRAFAASSFLLSSSSSPFDEVRPQLLLTLPPTLLLLIPVLLPL